MNWDEARSMIQTSIKVGTDLNSANSTYRFVKSVDSVIQSKSYGYHELNASREAGPCDFASFPQPE
jgi:hypothetical protein